MKLDLLIFMLDFKDLNNAVFGHVSLCQIKSLVCQLEYW